MVQQGETVIERRWGQMAAEQVRQERRGGGRPLGPLLAVVVVSLLVVGSLVFGLAYKERYGIAAEQRDRAMAELAVERERAQPSCRVARYVERSGVERVFVWDAGRAVRMPDRNMAWMQVEPVGNVWALVREGAGGERMLDQAGQPGEWLTFEGVWCGVGEPGVADVASVK